MNVEPTDVWGAYKGLCAWCISQGAIKSYIDTDSQGDLVRYHTCEACYEALAPSEVSV